MPIAEKEFVLNHAYNRWQYNRKRNIGPTSATIRIVKPSSLKEWEAFFFANMCSESRMIEFGRQLYQHVSQDLPSERRFHPDLLASITEQDCINYVFDVAIRRTYNGYAREHGYE